MEKRRHLCSQRQYSISLKRVVPLDDIDKILAEHGENPSSDVLGLRHHCGTPSFCRLSLCGTWASRNETTFALHALPGSLTAHSALRAHNVWCKMTAFRSSTSMRTARTWSWITAILGFRGPIPEDSSAICRYVTHRMSQSSPSLRVLLLYVIQGGNNPDAHANEFWVIYKSRVGIRTFRTTLDFYRYANLPRTASPRICIDLAWIETLSRMQI